MPDEAPLEEGPTPEPERGEPTLRDPGLRDLSLRDYRAVLVRAAKRMVDDNMPMIASALAYSTFFAIPAVLLLAVGVFTLVAGPDTIARVMDEFAKVMPSQAASLLRGSLTQLAARPSTGITLTALGVVLALWSTTGAMNAYMTAVNIAYERKDRRSFVKRRLIALLLAGCIGLAFLLVAVFLIFGPHIEKWVGNALGIEGALKYAWWAAQWPILMVALLAAFATLLSVGPDVDEPKWRFVTPGSVVAAAIWLVVSGAFAVYTARFGSYNKTWGSLSAVIVMLTWLWLTALALLFGAEINAELERSRELREGKPEERPVAAHPLTSR